MNPARTISGAPAPSRRENSLAYRSVFANLLIKELGESRSAIVAGLAIFWVMPAFLEFVYARVDADHEFLHGFAWIFLLAAGWLYAIVVGAHTVCRDWGKDEERFLLAQPVAPRSVVAAKLLAGALIVAVVFAVGAVWDLFASRFLSDAEDAETYWRIAAMTVGLVGVAYSLAFAGAVVTRQTLTSVLLACLVLLMWAIAPLLSTPLAALHPNWEMGVTQPGSIGPVFAVVTVLAIVGCVILALIASTRERVIRLGHKPLAWTVALVVLALFGMAYMEVGNALTVVDEGVIPLAERQPIYGWIQVGARDDAIYAVFTPHYSDEHPAPDTFCVAGFRVDRDGRIVAARRDALPVPGKLRDLGSEGECRFAHLSTVTVDDSGHLLAMGSVRANRKDGQDRSRRRLERFWQAKYAWADGASPELVSLSEIPVALRSQRYGGHLTSWALSGRYAYVIYAKNLSPVAERALQRSSGYGTIGTELVAFDWSDGPNAEPRHRFELPVMVTRVRASGDKIMLLNDEWWNLATFDADHPESLGELVHKLKKWGATLVDQEAIARYASAFGIAGSDVTVTAQDDLIYVRHLFGLKVLRWDASPQVEDFVYVGECRSSPLTSLWQTRYRYLPPRLLDGLYVEIGSFLGPVVTLFDVADPTRPRRVGFFHDHRSWVDGTQSEIEHVIPVGDHLAMIRPVVRSHSSGKIAELVVTVADRPKTTRHP